MATFRAKVMEKLASWQLRHTAGGEEETARPPLRERLTVLFLLVSAYTVLSIVALYPTPLQPNTRIVGGGELGGWLWRYWLMKLELNALFAELSSRPWRLVLEVLSLGRFPETGNVTDLYLMSYPLELIFGHPAYYNVKCYLILLLNALSGYVLARHFTSSRVIGFVGGMVAGFNSFVFLELYESGLRQAILWWLLLSVYFLEKTLERGGLKNGLFAGVCFGLTGAFYWFYALFLGMYAVVRVAFRLPMLGRERLKPRLVGLLVLAGVGLSIAFLFAYPYVFVKTDHTGALPELQWFRAFPTLEELANAPKTPKALQDNLSSSLARVLISSWSLDYAWNPLHPRNLTLMILGVGILPSLVRLRKEAFFLLMAVFFWLHTGGPYLQGTFEGGDPTFVSLGGGPVKLPYYYTFKFVPLMSRLFAPYRAGGMLWVLLTVLLVRNLEAFQGRLSRRRWGLPVTCSLFVCLYLGQYLMDDWLVETFKPGQLGLSGRGLPVDSSEIKVHPFYDALSQETGRVGIIELPLHAQQDLVNYYQVIHQKKLFSGWAVPGALPPTLRFAQSSSQPATKRLLRIAEPDTPMANSFSQALENFNQPPYVLQAFGEDDMRDLGRRGFKYVVLHERGCFVLLPRRGSELYAAMRRRLAQNLGESKEFVEFLTPDDPEFGKLEAGIPGEWASSALSGVAEMPSRFHMTVFRMPGFQEAPL